MTEGARLNRVDIARDVITSGVLPEQPARLTRRKRHVIVDTDTYGDHASVWFIRRGHGGEPVDETLDFELVEGVWQYHGGGGGEPGADLQERPTMSDVEAMNATPWRSCPFGLYLGGSYGKGRATLRMQAAADVVLVRFSDRDERKLAAHGFFSVVYNPRRPPTISAFDGTGESLGEYVPERRGRPGSQLFRRFRRKRRVRHGVAPA